MKCQRRRLARLQSAEVCTTAVGQDCSRFQTDFPSCSNEPAYRGLVIAPSEAEDTSAAYLPKTPPG